MYALVEKASACDSLYKSDEAGTLLEEAKVLITGMSDAEREQTKVEQAYFLTIVGGLGYYSKTLGDPQQALEQSVTLWKTLDQPFNLARALYRLGGRTDEFAPLERALVMWKKLDNEYEYANTACQLGALYRDKGDLNAAMNFNQEALKLSKALGYKKGIASALYCIGSNHEDHGDLDQALLIHHQVLQLDEELDFRFHATAVLLNLGDNYFKKHKLDKARHFFQRALSERKKLTTMDIFLIRPLLYLVQVALASNNRDEALGYQQHIQQIIAASKLVDPQAILYSQIVNALILKSSKRLKDKIEAQKILETLLQQETNIRPWNFYVLIVRNICELLLEELKLYGEPEVLAEIETHLSTLQATAKDQFEYSTMVEMLILRAKLELLNSRLQEAQHLLHEALAITQEKGLKLLQKKIEQEQQQLEQDFASWTELVENNAPMQDRIHRAQLDQYIKDALKYSQKDD